MRGRFYRQIDGKSSNGCYASLASLCNMAHRGAIDADAKTGEAPVW